MIQIVPCPDCQCALLLPVAVSLEATLACPTCQSSFVLGEMLDAQYASWNVVNDPRAASGDQAADAATLVGGEYDARYGDDSEHSAITENTRALGDASGELRLADAEGAKSASSKLAGAKSGANWSNFQPITHDQYERMKRKSRSPIWSILQVALGGLAAIPVSLLLLWYGLGKDVGGAGPWVGQFAPWIVPEKFRPFDAMADKPGGERGGDGANERQRAKGESGFRQFDDELGGAAASGNRAEVSAMGAGAVEERSADSDASGRGPADVQTMPEAATAGSPTLAEPLPVASSELSDLNDAGSQTIFARIQSCENSLAQWRAAFVGASEAETSAPDLKRLALSIYSDLASLADDIDTLPQANPVLRVVRDSMQSIGRNVKRNSDLQQVVEQGSKFWLDKYSEQPRVPVALIVELADVSEVGNQWVLTVADAAVGIDEFRVPSFLAPSLIPGQRLLLLGVVDDIATQPEVHAEVESDLASAPSVRRFTACYLHAL